MLFLKSSSEKGISSLSERTVTHSSPPGLTQGAFSHISQSGAETEVMRLTLDLWALNSQKALKK